VYTNHILEVYKVGLPILRTLLISFILNNTSFFCPNFRTLSVKVKDNKLYLFFLSYLFLFYLSFILLLWTKD